MNAFEAAEKNGRAAELQKELEELFSSQNTSATATSIPATFLRVTVNDDPRGPPALMKSAAVAASVFVGASAGAPNQSEPCRDPHPVARGRHVFRHALHGGTRLRSDGVVLAMGTCVFGIFHVIRELGATTIGELQAVRHDAGTGALDVIGQADDSVFKLHGATAYKPTHDVFTFDGRLEATRISGGLVHVNQADQPGCRLDSAEAAPRARGGPPPTRPTWLTAPAPSPPQWCSLEVRASAVRSCCSFLWHWRSSWVRRRRP